MHTIDVALPFGAKTHHITPIFAALLTALVLSACSGSPSRSDDTPSCVITDGDIAVGESVDLASVCQRCTCQDDLSLKCVPYTCEGEENNAQDNSNNNEDEDNSGNNGEPMDTGADAPDVGLDVEPDAADTSEADTPDALEDVAPDVADEGLCVDHDFDGFYTCVDPEYPERPTEIDCNDREPAIRPGGYEFLENGRDDDCDGETDEVTLCACDDGPGALGLAGGMGLCDETLISANLLEGESQQVAAVTDYFGVMPQAGGCLTVLSTGVAEGMNVQEGTGLNFFMSFDDPDPDPNAVPDPFVDGVYDLVTLELELRPPPGAEAFRFDFMFLSSEWPEFLCQSFNDTFYAVIETSAVQSGQRTNISFDADGNEITVDVGFFELPRVGGVLGGACDQDTSCEDDGASCVDGLCVRLACTPGAAGCGCDADGVCAEPDTECVQDQCVTVGCTPGELGCNCDSSAMCGGSASCVDGFCADAACTPGSRGCSCEAAGMCRDGLICDSGVVCQDEAIATIDLSSTPFGGLDGGQACFPVFGGGCTLPDYCAEQDQENLGFIGSGTGWLTTQAPVQPGEQSVKLTFTVHDEGDDIYDSMVLIDNFRWLPYRTSVGTVKE